MTLNHRFRNILIGILLTGAVTVYFSREHFDVEALEQWVSDNPLSAPFLFIFLYVVLIILFFPSIVLSLTGGVLFGPVLGTLCIQTGAILGAALAFLLTRYLLADQVESILGENMRQLKTGVERRGWRFVLMLRIIPGLPYTLLNYALGLTKIRFLHFLGVTFACILPRTILYAIAGDTGRKAIAGKNISIEGLIVVGLFITFIVLPYMLKKLKQSSLPPRID